MTDLIKFTPPQMALLRRTVAKDTNDTEFNLFVELCKVRGLNPLVRHVYCMVMSKDKPDKRQMVIVVSIDGQRHLAEKSGNYRGDDRAPRFEVDASLIDVATNPAGLVSAEVSVYKFSHGSWFPVTAVSYWSEAAPIKEIWENNKPSGKFQLEPKKDGWRKMPRLMLAKVAEMQALRKAFPDSFSGLYGEAEMDRGEVLDLSPSEWAEKAEQDDRIARIGGSDTYITDWLDGNELQAVPAGKYADAVMAFIRSCPGEPSTIRIWRERNRHSFNQFWAMHKGDALRLKAELEKAERAPADEQLDIVDAIAAKVAAQ